jgi:hypothetical protein
MSCEIRDGADDPNAGSNAEGRELGTKTTTDSAGKLQLVSDELLHDAASHDVQMPQRLEKMRDVPFPGGVDLQYLVKELAKDLD